MMVVAKTSGYLLAALDTLRGILVGRLRGPISMTSTSTSTSSRVARLRLALSQGGVGDVVT